MVSKMPSTLAAPVLIATFCSPSARGALEPALSDLGEAAAIVPDAAELDPGVRQRVEQFLGADLDAERCSEVARRRRALGRGDDIGADADHDREARRDRFRLQQNARELLLPASTSLGHFRPN